MPSDFITNLLKGPAYTKEYKEEFEKKLLKSFTENIKDKNIFASEEDFIKYYKENCKENMPISKFLDMYSEGADKEYLDALDYMMDSDGDDLVSSPEIDDFFSGIYEIYGNSVNDSKGNTPEKSDAQTMKDYLLDNEKWLTTTGGNIVADGKLSEDELNAFFEKNNLIKDGKIDNSAFDDWYKNNSGKGEKKYADAIQRYADKINIEDTNKDGSNLDEAKSVMFKAMEDLYKNKADYIDNKIANGIETTPDGKPLSANGTYINNSHEYETFDRSKFEEKVITNDKKWSTKGKIESKEYRDSKGTLRCVDNYSYSSGEKSSSTIYDENGNKQREENYHNGKLSSATVYDENGNKTEFYKFDKNGKVTSIVRYDASGEVIEETSNTFKDNKLSSSKRKSSNDLTTESKFSDGKLSEKTVTDSSGNKSIEFYDSKGKVTKIHKFVEKDGKQVIEVFDKNGKSTGEYLNLDGTKYTPENDTKE